MNITQKEVAAAANVSQTLVSLVLSEARTGASSQSALRVGPETRQKILDVAHRLGYVGRSERRQITPAKSLLYLRRREKRQNQPEIPETDRMVEALQNALIEEVFQRGFTLVVRLYEQPGEVLPSVLDEAVNGVFFGMAEPELIAAFSQKMPVVTLEEKPLMASDVVVADHRDRIDRALEYLTRHGHTRIALPTTHLSRRMAALYGAAFDEISECLGKSIRPHYVDCCVARDFLDRFLDPLQSADGRPTALIAEESLALSIQNEASRRGLSLPNDLSVVGLGHSSASAFSSPLLTTVDVDPGEIVGAAVSLMTERLKVGGVDFACRKIEVAARLIERASVAGLQGNPTPKSRKQISKPFPETQPEVDSVRPQNPQKQ